VTEVRAAPNLEAAEWLLDADVSWSDLVRYGPPSFPAYVRICFAGDNEADTVRDALMLLEAYTVTPDLGFAAIWEGWTGTESAASAPRVSIPNRTMLLFTAPVRYLRDAATLAWYGAPTRRGQEPHLVWPEDQAWCLACEVDEEIEFTVGCSEEAARALADHLPGIVRRVAYGEGHSA
jgi:hypothetical protein